MWQRTFGVVLLGATLLPGIAQAAETLPADGLVWRWDPTQVRRYYFETEVVLPGYLWFLADRNKDVRVVAFQVRTATTCDHATPHGKRIDVVCKIDDFGIVAAAMPGDQRDGDSSPLPSILEEIDGKLTGAELDFTIRSDGRVVSFDIGGLDRSERRMGLMNETMRSVVQRAVAGLDLELPADGHNADGLWMQHEVLLMRAPTQVGTPGATDLQNRVLSVDGSTVVVETAGKGVIAFAQNLYASELSSVAVFDTASGGLVERVWTVSGSPTASSAAALGAAGLRYLQRGKLRLLADGETADVGTNQEVAPPGATPTALTPWQSIAGSF